MTRVLTETLESLGLIWQLVDRRFSSTADEVGRFAFRKVSSGLGLISRLIGAMLRKRPSVVIFFATTRGASFVVDWILSEILRLFSVPVILYVHTIGFADLADRGSLWAFMVRRLLRTGREVVVLGPGLVDDVSPFGAKSVRVIANALPEEPDRTSRAGAGQRRNTVLFLSNLIPGKGHQDFLYAARYCIAAGIEVNFLLAGAASRRVSCDIEEYAASFEGGQAIEYVGPVSGSAKWNLLHSSRVFVFPSRKEAFGLAPLEAAACGLPILGYRVGALAPVLAQDGAARIIDNIGNRDELAAALLEMLRDPESSYRMGEAAAMLYGQKFSRDVYTQKWRELLSEYV